MDLDTRRLLSEYRLLVKQLGADASNEDVVTALVRHGDWSIRGAVTLNMLATQYGVFVLRNALALAAALGVEDGDAGL